jgi:hypothetical protein
MRISNEAHERSEETCSSRANGLIGHGVETPTASAWSATHKPPARPCPDFASSGSPDPPAGRQRAQEVAAEARWLTRYSFNSC